MRQLYLVGFSADRQSVHLSHSPEQPPEFRLEAGEELLALLASRDGDGPTGAARPRRRARESGATDADPTAVGAPSRRLSPREIQARLRSGLTVSEVAAEAGVDPSWVDRFAAPIMAEQAAALQRACALTLTSTSKGASAAPLGVALVRNLAERGVRPPADVDLWSAHLHHASTWVIRYSHHWRGRVTEAEWLADLAAGALGARNRLATDLGWLDPDLDSPRPDQAGTAVPAEPAPIGTRPAARVAGAAAPTRARRPATTRSEGGGGPGAPAAAPRTRVAVRQAPKSKPSPSRTTAAGTPAATGFGARRRPLPSPPME